MKDEQPPHRSAFILHRLKIYVSTQSSKEKVSGSGAVAPLRCRLARGRVGAATGRAFKSAFHPGALGQRADPERAAATTR